MHAQEIGSSRVARGGFLFSVLLVLALVTSSVFAQVDSVFRYFPLHKGDFHQLHYHYSHCLSSYSSYSTRRVLGDTLLSTGFRYTAVLGSGSYLEYLRVDSLSANVYRYDPYPSPRDVLKDSLRATPGSSFYSEWGFQTVCLSIDTLTVLGVPTTVKTFRQEFIHGAVYLLAYGFGRIRYVSFEEDPCYPLLYSVVTDLVYAKIDGREYGTFVNVQEKEESLPVLTQVSQNYPNPFNPMTNIEYRIENAGFVSLKVYDMLGREVATLVNEQINPGTYQVIWDATGMPSGVYFYRLRAGELTETRKLMLLR